MAGDGTLFLVVTAPGGSAPVVDPAAAAFVAALSDDDLSLVGELNIRSYSGGSYDGAAGKLGSSMAS